MNQIANIDFYGEPLVLVCYVFSQEAMATAIAFY